MAKMSRNRKTAAKIKGAALTNLQLPGKKLTGSYRLKFFRACLSPTRRQVLSSFGGSRGGRTKSG